MKNLMFWMVAALVIILFWNVSSRIQQKERELSFSSFMASVDQGNVAEVTITGTTAGAHIVGTLKNGESVRTFAPAQYDGLVDKMLASGIEVSAQDANGSSWLIKAGCTRVDSPNWVCSVIANNFIA